MNFVDYKSNELYLSNFVDQKNLSSNTSLKLGGNSLRNDLPIQDCHVRIGELIIFDKPLSPLGKSILETSLALKYSITLAPLTDYLLEPNGIVLWNASENSSFHFNIAGIAKNESLDLYQKQSQSKVEYGFLSIGLTNIYETNEANPSVFESNQSLVWGDNNESLAFVMQHSGIEYIKRKWLIDNQGFNTEFFTVDLNSNSIIKQIPEEHDLWLKVKKGDDSKLFKFTSSSIDSVSFYEGSQIISFLHAPEKWIDVNINESNCQKGALASMTLQTFGVSVPFKIEIEDEHSNTIVEHVNSENQVISMDELMAGRYTARVIKDDRTLIHQPFNISDKSIPTLFISDHYIFEEKDNRKIDASLGNNEEWNYEWTSPSNQITYGSLIEMNESGIYWLKIYNKECQTWMPVHVEILENNIESVLVYPNPSPDGQFKLEVELKNQYSLEIEIVNVLGGGIYSKKYAPSLIIKDHIQLPGNGMYFISFKSANSLVTKKLIVQAN